MNKTLLIIKREFWTRVQKRSFIILTLLMPFLFAAIAAVPVLLGQIEDKEQKKVVVIDQTGLYNNLFQDDASYDFVYEKHIRPEYKDKESTVEAVIEIKHNLLDDAKAVSISSAREVQSKLQNHVEKVLNERIREDKLARYNIPQLDKIVQDMDQSLNVQTIKWNADGEDSFSSSDVAVAVGFFFTLLIYMFVMSYGSMVMQSVIEEKTNRIMEIMVSSVRPFQLLMGKIIGVALVGFFQMAIWGTTLAGLLFVVGQFLAPEASSMNAAAIGAGGVPGANPAVLAEAASGTSAELYTALLNLPFAELGIMFVLYFIGGYLLFASFFAAMGASVNTAEDASQFTLPMIMVMIFGLYAAMGSLENTHGPLAFWASLFPLTSPIVMMVRIPFDVPLWQEQLSLLLLYASAIGMVWFSAKIYRVGILMYGKKPNFKEMLKWMRYK